MDDPNPLTATTVSLAGQSTELSARLNTLHCDHSSKDVTAIAEELAILSTTLWRLHDAMSSNAERYTPAFKEDLKEITDELKLILQEISECTEELQKADGGNSAVAWLFKKGRVHRLQKHLEALKTTLIVMRTVLWHGKDYGTQNSPGRLAESSPHTMYEDRVILESAIAKNRNAIVDLHNLDEAKRHSHSSSSTSSVAGASPAAAGTHHHKFSAATGVDLPPFTDVLPISKQTEKENKAKALANPARRFSKRGVRLGVHMSILDMNAHDAPRSLRQKWIHQASGLSHISEVDSMMSVPKERERVDLQDILNEQPVSPLRRDDTVDNEIRESTPEEIVKHRKSSLAAVGHGLGKIMRRLTITAHTIDKDKGKLRQDAGDASEKENRGSGLGRRLSVLAGGISPLRTPDYEKEFENGRF